MLSFGSDFPSYNGITLFKEVRLYYEQSESSGRCATADAGIVSNNSPYVYANITDLDSQDSFEVDRRFFSGFENGTTYVFKLALVDEAGNIGLFTPDFACSDEFHVATPDNVYGVIDPNSKCFITESVTGTNLSSSIDIFRKFRDQKLNNHWGRKFTNHYYTISPYLVDIIKDNYLLKTISRIIILPKVIFAYLALCIGFIGTLVLFIFLMFIGSISLKQLGKSKI